MSRVHQRQDRLATIRRLPLREELARQLEAAAEEAGVEVEVYSGGQAARGTRGLRTGSTRHDLGGAADVRLFRVEGGEEKFLSAARPEDLAVMSKFIEAAVAAGVTGVGQGREYMGDERMHVGGGSVAAWGKGGRSKFAPQWLREALAAGLARRKK